MKMRNSVKKRNGNVFLLRRTSITTINPMQVVNILFTEDLDEKEIFKC